MEGATRAPGTDIQFPINQQLLEEATRLKEERRMLHERLAKIEATRNDVSASVYDRVRGDYQRRYDETHQALLLKKQEVDRELATLHETAQKIADNLGSHTEVLEEVQLRHSLGEYDAGVYKEQASQAAEKIQKFEKLLAAVRSNIQSYEGIFASEPDLLEQRPAETPVKPSAPPPPPPPPAPEAPLTSILPVREASDSTEEENDDYFLEEDEGDYFDAGKEEPPPPETAKHITTDIPPLAKGPRLTIVRGENTGKAFAVQKETTIGRAANNGVVLKESKISRQHAVVRKQGNRFAIEDLQSSNGLYVNGVRVMDHVLENGDEIQIGDFVLKFSI